MSNYNYFYVCVVCLMVFCCEACNTLKSPCTLNGTSGNISSPGYPSKYPHNANISWLIQVPPSHTVKLSFQDFALENDKNCQFDHVTIYDGPSTTGSPIIGKYCGHLKPPDDFSTGTQLLVVLITDSVYEDIGFIGRYQAIKEVSSCSSNNSDAENTNIILKKNVGSLLTYLDINTTTAQCTWKLRAPKGFGIRVTFLSLNFLNNMTGCSQGSVELYGGYFMQKSSMIERFCGDNSVLTSPIIKYNPYSAAIIDLQVTQASVWTAHSLVVNYEFIYKETNRCSIFNDFNENNNIQLHGHRGNLEFNASDWTNVKCRWRISAPDGLQVKLKFVDVRLEWNPDCRKSYVQIFDGESRDRGKFCGRETPWVIFSTAGFLYVKLVVSGAKTGSAGFTAMYEAVTKAIGKCSTINSVEMNSNIHLGGSTGMLMSPNYPSPYPARATCIWTITVPRHYRVRLHFKTFRLEAYKCKFDYVQIRDGGTNESVIKRKRLCGDSKVPGDVYSSSNQLWVKFKSDGFDERKGFLASYRSVLPEPSICSLANTGIENENIQVNGSSGFLTSPNYPRPYPSNIRCIWYITVPKRLSKIIVYISDFALDACCNGYLALFDGDCLCNTLGRYSANDTPVTMVSSGNSLKVAFIPSRTSSNRKGIKLFYHSPTKAPGICSVAFLQSINDNLYLNSSSGQVTSPDYPFPYISGTQCTWYARAPRGFRVQLSITKVDLPMVCLNDYLVVYDGDSPRSPPKGKLCDIQSPRHIHSSGQNMLLKFVSHYSLTPVKHKGFVANYRMVKAGNCSKDFDESWNTNLRFEESTFGGFSSPGYPRHYPSDIRCTWKVTAPNGYQVKLKLTAISLGRPCSTDFLEVRDGFHSTSSHLGKFCGSAPGKALMSSGRYLLVHFESGKNSSLGNGFEASFTTVRDGNPNSKSMYAKVLTISLVAVASFAMITVSSLCIYWVFKKRCRQPSHSDPSIHDDTALSPLPPPPLGDIPTCLIAEDRPPSYSEVVESEQEEQNQQPSGHQTETADQDTSRAHQLRLVERGLDNLAFTNDPPSYESLYGADPT